MAGRLYLESCCAYKVRIPKPASLPRLPRGSALPPLHLLRCTHHHARERRRTPCLVSRASTYCCLTTHTVTCAPPPPSRLAFSCLTPGHTRFTLPHTPACRICRTDGRHPAHLRTHHTPPPAPTAHRTLPRADAPTTTPIFPPNPTTAGPPPLHAGGGRKDMDGRTSAPSSHPHQADMNYGM